MMVPRSQGHGFAAALAFLVFLGLTEAQGNCQPPPGSLSLHEVNVTAEEETLLFTEGRCYLACLREGGVHQVLACPCSVLVGVGVASKLGAYLLCSHSDIPNLLSLLPPPALTAISLSFRGKIRIT